MTNITIEVACKRSDSSKDKGDLLEELAKKLLVTQNYDVIKNIRTISAELDLLCKHKINGKEILVECKAQKEPISASILYKLWGIVESEGYSEGWLISTSDLTKDAKGFVEKWKSKDKEKSSRLSFYTPNFIIESLVNSSIIIEPPIRDAKNFVGEQELLGDWVLLISKYGLYWCVYTLKGGTPYGVLIYRAESGAHIQDEDTINPA